MAVEAESKIDSIVDIAVKIYQAKKRPIWIICTLLFIGFLSQVSQNFEFYIYTPIMDAVSNGMSSGAVAHAVALGVCSGLCAPGFRFLSMLLLAEFVHFASGIHITVTMLAISATINTALTVPNLFIWKAVYFNIGTKLFSGGKYVRPFLAGMIPWAISVPVLYILFFRLAKYEIMYAFG